MKHYHLIFSQVSPDVISLWLLGWLSHFQHVFQVCSNFPHILAIKQRKRWGPGQVPFYKKREHRSWAHLICLKSQWPEISQTWPLNFKIHVLSNSLIFCSPFLKFLFWLIFCLVRILRLVIASNGADPFYIFWILAYPHISFFFFLTLVNDQFSS